MDRQEQEQLDVQIDIDESLIREREERIRQIEVSPLQQQQLYCKKLLRTDPQIAKLILFGQSPAMRLVREPVCYYAL